MEGSLVTNDPTKHHWYVACNAQWLFSFLDVLGGMHKSDCPDDNMTEGAPVENLYYRTNYARYSMKSIRRREVPEWDIFCGF